MRQNRTKIGQNEEAKKLADQLHHKGFSRRQIAEKVSDETDISVSHVAVGNYLDKKAEISKEVLEQDQEWRQSVREEVIDVVKTMEKIANKLEDIIDDPDASNNEKIKAANSMMRQLKLHEKMLGKMLPDGAKVEQKNETHINVDNSIDFAVKVDKRLKKLEKQGYITIEKELPGLKAEEEREKLKSDT